MGCYLMKLHTTPPGSGNSSTVAIFGCGPTKPDPAVEPEPQRLPAPNRNGLAVGVRTSLRCGSRRERGTPLPAPPSGSSLEDAPHEQGWRFLYINLDL